MAVVATGNPIVTFLSDFGLRDNYVGIVKAVLLGLNPKLKIIDICHEAPAFNVRAARYLLETAYAQFVPGTIHLAIVDPGVGTHRRAILVETDDYFFVGPDNGLFSFLAPGQIRRALSLNKRKYFLREISSTFHGRDVFAPVAAYLSLGVSPDEMGTSLKSIVRPAFGGVARKGNSLTGSVIYIDHFGNLVTSIREDDLPRGRLKVRIEGRKIGPIRKTFGSVVVGKVTSYVNSFGYIEIALREGSAGEYFGIEYGSKAKILIAPE